MRPIDADALKEKIDSMWNGRPLSFLGARILVTIDEAPTIDADRPQGEVDAIDRNALIDYCLKLIDVERKQGSDAMNYGQERVNQTEAIIDYIEHMPHLYADRPSGEWIDRGMRVPSSWVKKCSLCGHETDTWRWCKFCPNCGAKMSNASNASNTLATLATLEKGETE